MTKYKYKAASHLWYLTNKEEKDRKNKEWYLANREEFLKKQREKRHQPEEMAKNRLRNKMYRAQNRAKLVDFLGGKCVKCGIIDYRVLQIDHSKSGGRAEQLLHHAGGPAWWHRYYLKHPDQAKEHLQMLCANCNIIKAMEGHEGRHYRDVPLEYTIRK